MNNSMTQPTGYDSPIILRIVIQPHNYWTRTENKFYGVLEMAY